MSDDPRKPFKVRTTEGTLRSSHFTEKDAEAACEQANSQAKALAIRARYVTQS